MAANSANDNRKTSSRLSWRAWFSIAFAVVFFALYWIRPFATEGITIWPSWIWAVPGVLFAIERPKRLFRAVRWPLVAWLAVSLAFSEVWRIVLPRNLADHDIRVVTLNTAGNMSGAMREVARLHPDIVLLQESADFAGADRAAKDMFGAEYTGVIGHDASVFVRGEVLSSYSKQSNFTIAHVRLASGRELDVVSLRLHAPFVRVDYLNKDCWRSYSRHRANHLEELTELWRRVQDHRNSDTMVLGGDFNLVPDSKDKEILGPDLVDSYRVAGRGWYATALDGAMLFRIDKVWTTHNLKAKGTYSMDSEASDHRYVVAQFDWIR